MIARCIEGMNYLTGILIRQRQESIHYSPEMYCDIRVAPLQMRHECRGTRIDIHLTEARAGSIVLPIMFTDGLERALHEALTYSDIFEYPLRLDELYRYLPVRAEMEELSIALESLNGRVGKTDGFYFLAGHDEIVEIRKQREARSRSLLPRAIKYGRVLGSLPFIRMVALTGSLAVMNISKAADFDYMLVTVPGRVWTARAFALAFNRLTRAQGHTLCPNLIISETALEWPLHDLYSARELCQMIPITGMNVYRQVLDMNLWAQDFLPNAFNANAAKKEKKNSRNSPLRVIRIKKIQSLFESFLRGKLGNLFERWEMNRKIARFQKQDGFGEETVFNAEVCQGNFHHHREWTREVFREKLDTLNRKFETPKERSREFV